jgi:hypothetical protein
MIKTKFKIGWKGDPLYFCDGVHGISTPTGQLVRPVYRKLMDPENLELYYYVIRSGFYYIWTSPDCYNLIVWQFGDLHKDFTIDNPTHFYTLRKEITSLNKGQLIPIPPRHLWAAIYETIDLDRYVWDEHESYRINIRLANPDEGEMI